MIPLFKKASTEWDRVMALAAKMSPRLRDAFIASMADLVNSVSLAEVIRLLEAGRIEQLIDLAPESTQLSAFREAIQEAVASAGKFRYDSLAATGGRFDLFDPRAVQFIQTYSFNLIRQIKSGLREAIRESVTVGIQLGQNPRETAREIKSISTFGLNSTQRRAVRNFKRMLQQGDPEALTRELRDKRYDGTLRRAFRTGSGLTKEQVNKMTEAYERKMLAYRAEMISRTEALRALSAGQRLAWEQNITENRLDRSTIRRTWIVARDERLCQICAPIPSLNPKGVGFDEPFATPDGPMMDPPIHPHCRCTIMISERKTKK